MKENVLLFTNKFINFLLILSFLFISTFYCKDCLGLVKNFPLLSIVLFSIFSCIVISRASDSFEIGADYVGEKLGMSGGVKGATLDAVAGSFPEMITTLIFLLLMRDANGFAGGIATTAGSGIFNAIVIPMAIIFSVKFVFNHKKKISINKKIVVRDGFSLLLTTYIFIRLANSDALYWYHGLAMVVLYLFYLILLKFWKIDSETDNNEIFDNHLKERDEKIGKNGVLSKESRLLEIFKLNFETAISGNKNMSWGRALRLIFISMTIMGVACHILVEACNMLGHYIAVPSYVVAIVLVAAATSIPDTVLSIKSSKKGKYEDALTNALGSNIFDISFAIGLPLLLYTAFFGSINMVGEQGSLFIAEFQSILFLITLVLIIMFLVSKFMDKLQLFIMLGMYLLFLFYVYCFSYNCDCLIYQYMRSVVLFVKSILL
ncbi:MAG: hypothetical protein N4A44_05070 [Alphaproteobacteria bacterium]|jgi:cation:H+ antiporter|nr:hypothetical protein [Alphaproteobacteria bacterium]